MGSASDLEQQVWNTADSTIALGRVVQGLAQALTYVAAAAGACWFVVGLQADVSSVGRVAWCVGAVIWTLSVVVVWQAVSLYGLRSRLDGLRAQMEVLNVDSDGDDDGG